MSLRRAVCPRGDMGRGDGGFRPVPVAREPNLFVWTDTCNVYVWRDGTAALLIDLGPADPLIFSRTHGPVSFFQRPGSSFRYC